MKKTITIFLIYIWFISCSVVNYSDQGKSDRDKIREIFISYLWYNERGYLYSPCRNYSGERNPVFMIPEYRDRFMAYSPGTTLIRGDSTMDLNGRISGFMSATTRNYAVAGNTLCDMIEQGGAIINQNPENIVISTAGGNDLGNGLYPSDVANSSRLLLEQTRLWFPNAKICMVSVHPTLSIRITKYKDDSNDLVKIELDKYTNTGWVDQLPVFGKARGEYADSDQMMDEIHYTETMAWDVRTAIKNNCGIDL